MKMICRLAVFFAAVTLSAAQWNFPADAAKVQSLPPERGLWRIPAGNLPDPGTAGATVEVDMKIGAKAKEERRRMVLAAHGTDTSLNGWVLSWISDGNVAAREQELRFSISLPGKQYYRFSVPALVEADTVARFTVTLDGKKIRFYQDGNLLQEKDCPVFLPRNPKAPLLIGGYPIIKNPMCFPGEILRVSVEPSLKVPQCTRKLAIPALYYRNYDCSYAAAPAPAQHPFVRTEEAVLRARNNVKNFDWAKKVQENVLKNAERALGLTEKDLAFYISDLPGSDCSCPKCGEPSNIAWPYLDTKIDTLICAACKTVFPSEEYPEDKEFVLTLDNGRVLKMKYHEGPSTKMNEGSRYFLSGVLRQRRIGVLLSFFTDAANAYLLTGDLKYARAVRAILLRFAQVYPGYPSRLRNTYYSSHGNNSWAGKFYRWKFGDNQHILKIASAYDAIYGSGVLSDADKVAIENGIFREYKKLLTAMPPWSDLTNSMVYGYAGMIFAGRILADPEMIRWVTEGPQSLNAFVRTWFHRDGFWHENACSYQGMAINAMNLLLVGLEGYSDPAHYRKSDRYDNLKVAEKLPMIGKAFRSAAFATLPNGCLPAANDSIASARYSSRFAKYARIYFDSPDSREIFRYFGGDGDADRSVDDLFEFDETMFRELRPEPVPEFLTASRIFPGPRWMLLRSGFGKESGAMLLDYGEKYLFHVHTPSLNFHYFDYGTDLVTDIGYLSAQHKATVFNKSTVAHVTVMVDEQPHHAGSRRRTDPEFFAARPGTFRAMQASAPGAYPDVVSRFERTLFYVDRGEGARYGVDFFEVAGGKSHTYLFHAPGEDFRAPADWKWSDCDAVSLLGGKPTGANWLTGGKTAPFTGGETFAWYDRNPEIPGLIFQVPEGLSGSLITASAPGNRDPRDPMNPRRMQILGLRRTGGANFFAGVFAGFRGEPPVRKAELLPAENGRLLRVTAGEITDLFFTAEPGKEMTSAAYPALRFSGKAGAVSLKNGLLQEVFAVGGKLSFEKETLLAPEVQTVITAFDETARTITLAAPLPEAAAGDYLFVNEQRDGQYRIESVKGNVVTVSDTAPYTLAPGNTVKWTASARSFPLKIK